MSVNQDREFDIIVYGASGTVGRYVIEELCRSAAQPPLKWAVAGRNTRKLKEALAIVQELIGLDFSVSDIPILCASSENSSSLTQMCQRAKIIFNCVGPYKLCGGELVVAACIESGSHLIDLCAEIGFLEYIQSKYFESARANKVYIVQSCGFGSLPFDCGVYLMMKEFPGELNSVEYFTELKEGPKGRTIGLGTCASLCHSIPEFLRSRKIENLLSVIYKKTMPSPTYPLRRWWLLFYSRKVKSWCFPLIGPVQSSLQGSQRFRFEFLNEKPIQTNGYLKLVPLSFAIKFALFVPIIMLLSLFSKGYELLIKFPKLFSGGIFSPAGPTREQVLEQSVEITFFGEGWLQGEDTNAEPTSKMKLIINGPEAAYPLTAICMVQAGITLLQETEKLPLEGGVVTPGVAFEQTDLHKRLESSGISFRFEKSF